MFLFNYAFISNSYVPAFLGGPSGAWGKLTVNNWQKLRQTVIGHDTSRGKLDDTTTRHRATRHLDERNALV